MDAAARATRNKVADERVMGDPEHDIESLRQWAEEVPRVTRVWLFGSRARSDYGPDSDLDIAVETEAPKDHQEKMDDFFFRSDWLEPLQRRLTLKLDLWHYAPGEDRRLSTAIARSSRLIYERSDAR